VLKAAASGRRHPATRPGGLRDPVEAHLRQFPDAAFTPHQIDKVLTRSSGAVANALDKLVSLGVEAFDLTGTAWPAAQLAGATRRPSRYVTVGDAGSDPLAKTSRPRLIDGFMSKIEELVGRSKGKIRADVAHRKLAAMGYRGSERSTRRAVDVAAVGLWPRAARVRALLQRAPAQRPGP